MAMNDNNTMVYILMGKMNYRNAEIRGVYRTRELAESAKEELDSEYHPFDSIYIRKETLQTENQQRG